MTHRPFRFAVVAAPRGDSPAWLATARRVEELGYSTLLMPDVTALAEPFGALGMAAGTTTTLRVGTFVLAAPLRTPAQAAWAGHSLSALTGGRFEFGIGTGRADVASDVELFGLPYGPADQRLADVATAVDTLRGLDRGAHTSVLIAAGGPKARALAAEKADIVTLAAGPLAAREEVAAHAKEILTLAGGRAEAIELSMNVFVIGDNLSPELQGHLQLDAAELIAHDSLSMLRGTPQDMAEELQRRREAFGVSYISVNEMFLEEFAPVVELLKGH